MASIQKIANGWRAQVYVKGQRYDRTFPARQRPSNGPSRARLRYARSALAREARRTP